MKTTPHISSCASKSSPRRVLGRWCLALGFALANSAQAQFSFDDIAYWVGYGTNQAALVIDWDDGITPVSLAWGYRWNGAATGETMFDAVAAADPRLFLQKAPQGLGQIVFGCGYDVDNDGGGFTPGSPGFGSETGSAGDADDHYEEGWYSQYWQYFAGSGSPYEAGSWEPTGVGFQLRQLHDGDWDGWRIAAVAWPPPTNSTPPALCSAADPHSPAPRIPGHGFSFDDIEYWTGSGPQRAALLLDWHDGTHPHALVWGYRWSGTATALDLWQAVTNADPSLGASLTNTAEGLHVSECTYTREVRHGDILPGTGDHAVMHSAFAGDHPAPPPGGAWSHWGIDYTNTYHESVAKQTLAGLETRTLMDGSWDIWSHGTGAVARAPGWPAAALHYPYGDEVTSYVQGAGVGYDWLTGDLFTNAINSLGRPTVDTTGDQTPTMTHVRPVVPVYPAFRAHELVTIGAGGALTISFDHRVLDHPANPYGVDLLVFGNCNQLTGGGEEWTNGPPAETVVSASFNADDGVVSVSQDGVSWHALTNQGYADSFMPTLGRVHDPANVDTGAFSGNLWWGQATDPTIPPDPTVEGADWEGMHVAELTQRYRGGAGGVGFDIGDLDLPLCTNTGRKWIRYVRMEPSAALYPEIDAVADVSPMSPRNLWRMKHFAWMNDPDAEADAADPDGDTIPNIQEYGLGRDPTNAVATPPFSIELCTTNTPRVLLLHHSIAATATDVDIRIETVDDLLSADWTTNRIPPPTVVSSPTSGVASLTAEMTMESNRGFFRIQVQQDE